MSELLYIKEMEKVINNFLSPFELTGSYDTDFAYYYKEDKVTFSLTISKFDDMIYQEFIHSLCPELTVDTFLISLLHEVGHAETYDDLDDMEIAYSDDVKATIANELEMGVTTERKRQLYFEYFNLPDERAATEWAIEYLQSNAAAVSLEWKNISNAIVNFFQINDIEF